MPCKPVQIRHSAAVFICLALVTTIQICSVYCIAQSSKTTVRGKILQIINGSQAALMHSALSIAPASNRTELTLGYTDRLGMYTFVVPAPGSYILTVTSPKTKAVLKYTVTANTVAYTDIAPIILK
jgi:hypothetical protein